MIAMGTMNSDNIYEVPATSNTGSEIKIGEDAMKGEDIKRSNKLICLVASIVMLVAIVGCFVALFLEVAKLQSEASSFKKTLSKHPSSCAIYSRLIKALKTDMKILLTFRTAKYSS